MGYQLHPSGVFARLSAYFIDYSIQIILFMFTYSFLSVLLREIGFWIILIIIFLIRWFYFIFFEILMNGSSPGKKALGLRVVMDDGAPITPGASLLRNLLRFADGFLQLDLIGFLVMLFSPGFRRIGDWASGTVVVYTKGTSFFASSFQMPWLTNRPYVVPDRILSLSEKQSILSFCQRYPIIGKNRASEIAAVLVPSLTDSERAKKDPGGYLLALGATLSGYTINKKKSELP